MTYAIKQPMRESINQALVDWLPENLYAQHPGAEGALGYWDDWEYRNVLIDGPVLFTTSTGQTPVSAVGEAVGLVLDRSQGLVRGSELDDESLLPFRVYRTSTENVTYSPGYNLESGKYYEIEYSVSANPGSRSASFRIAGSASFSPTHAIAAGQTGTTKVILRATASGAFTVAGDSDGTDLTLSAFSVKPLPGSHISMPTSASRPVLGQEPLGGVRNLYLHTPDYGNTYWTSGRTATVTTNTDVAPDGTTTADTITDNSSTVEQDISNSAAGGNPIPSSTNVTFSFYVKKTSGATTFPQFRLIFDADVTERTFKLNTDTGATIANTGSCSVEADGDYWRVSYTQLTGATTSSVTTVIYPAASVDLADANTRDATLTGSIVLWISQAEAGSSATAPQRVGEWYDVSEDGVPPVYFLAGDGATWYMTIPGSASWAWMHDGTGGVFAAAAQFGTVANPDAAHTLFSSRANSSTAVGASFYYDDRSGFGFNDVASLALCNGSSLDVVNSANGALSPNAPAVVRSHYDLALSPDREVYIGGTLAASKDYAAPSSANADSDINLFRFPGGVLYGRVKLYAFLFLEAPNGLAASQAAQIDRWLARQAGVAL